MQTIDTAIKAHGAKRVYDAAAARMSGNRQPLAAIGLTAETIADAHAVMTAAFAAMSGADRAVDLTDLTIRQAKR